MIFWAGSRVIAAMRKAFLVRLEFDDGEFDLERVTREYVERVLGERVGGRGVSMRVGSSLGGLLEVPLGRFEGSMYVEEASDGILVIVHGGALKCGLEVCSENAQLTVWRSPEEGAGGGRKPSYARE